MSNKYNVTINLVEITKLVERKTCDTLVSSNYLQGKVYSDTATPINYNAKIIDGHPPLLSEIDVSALRYFTKIYKDTQITVPKFENSIRVTNPTYEIYGQRWSTIRIIYPDGTEIIRQFLDDNYIINTTQLGTYKVIYQMVTHSKNIDISFGTIDLEYVFQTIPLPVVPEPTQPTITSVLNRLLAVHNVRRVDKSPYYFLDPKIAEQFSNVPAPEFAFTRCTLKEALDQVGGFIHGVTRLKWDTESDEPRMISYDLLGGTSVYTLPESAKETGSAVTWDSGDHCDEIDSYVSNFVNTVDKRAGVITEPWEGFYKTLRTEYGKVRIDNNNAIYETEFPIYQIEKVEMGFVNSDTVIGDITEFMYESAEYQNLSGYLDSYPYSKAYALRYAQGGSVIDGFAFKIENPVSPALTLPALENILRKKGYTGAVPSYKDIALRISYIPVVGARVKQRNVDVSADGHNGLFYNQGANLVENNYYGQNMKGAIARMGRAVEMRTFYFKSFKDVPKIGQIFDGKYIAKVAKQFDKYFIKASVYLVDDFNMLSQFIGINSNRRYFEISEKQSFDRNINYSEDIVIGEENPTDTATTTAAMARFVSLLNGVAVSPVSVALIETKGVNGETIAKLAKTISSFACGNSLVFTFAMRDNFSAGARSVYLDSTQNLQQYLQYCNAYGELETMRIALFDKLIARAPTWGDQASTSTNPALEDLLPQYDGNEQNEAGKCADFELVVKKDSRERITLTYQLHFRITRNSIVLGTLLAQNNGLIKNTAGQKAPVIAFFTAPLNMLSGAPLKADWTTNMTASITTVGRTVTIEPIKNSTAQTYQSWGLVDPTTNELYIGENMEIAPNAETKPIVFNF